MKYDFLFFKRRYEQIEKDFLELTDFIEPQSDFNSPCYKFGSSKLMDFCLKVGTEIETLFRIILESSKFDLYTNINNKRDDQNIRIYLEFFEPEYQLSERELFVNSIKKDIRPFKEFTLDTSTPKWFKCYSKNKHNKLVLIKEWNLEYSLLALGALILLILLHPKRMSSEYAFSINSEVFYLSKSQSGSLMQILSH
jgi:hypothetical protein